MARAHGWRTQVYLNGIDLTDVFNNADGSQQADVAEVTAFGQQDKVFVAGLRNGTFKLGGWFDAAAGKSDATLSAILIAGSADAHLAVAERGVINGGGWAGLGLMTSYQRTAPIGGAVSVAADFQSNAGFDGVRVILPKSAITPAAGGGTTEAYNGGTATALGAIAYMHAFSIAAGTPVVAVEHSADGATGWANMLSFTGVTAAGAQKATATGTVQPYRRVVVTGGTITAWVGLHTPVN